MINIKVSVIVNASQQETWDKITDWKSHSRWIPFTKVWIKKESPSGIPNGIGTVFIGRTGFGPLAFDDPMEVKRFRPPMENGKAGKVWIGKTGSLVKGTADFQVIKIDKNTSEVLWKEAIETPVLFNTLKINSILEKFGNKMFAYSLGKMAKEFKA
jgi:hypothetical protein